MTETLITHILEGDEVAVAEFVSIYQQKIFRLAYLILGDPDHAADITQETFIAALKSLDRFDTSRDLLP